MKENNKEITNTNRDNKSDRECLVNDEKESARRKSGGRALPVEGPAWAWLKGGSHLGEFINSSEA